MKRPATSRPLPVLAAWALELASNPRRPDSVEDSALAGRRHELAAASYSRLTRRTGPGLRTAGRAPSRAPTPQTAGYQIGDPGSAAAVGRVMAPAAADRVRGLQVTVERGRRAGADRRTGQDSSRTAARRAPHSVQWAIMPENRRRLQGERVLGWPSWPPMPADSGDTDSAAAPKIHSSAVSVGVGSGFRRCKSRGPSR
jgi:hypothetical protein